MNCLNKNLNLSDYLALLARWVKAAERDYHPLDGTPDLGYYGTAYRHWGHQSIANYASAYATLATLASDDIIAISGVSRDFLYERALAALRYFLRLHTTGDLVSQDGTKWGTDWISGNLFLRGVAAIDALWDKFTDEDKQRVEKMVEAEAEHLMKQPIICNRWPERPELGRTNAEANSWNGSMLLHAIIYLPDHARKAAWWEQACRYFINTLSVPQDAEDQRLVDGRPIAEWHVGANLHPNFGFEHHGFLHFGYMVISLEELVFTWAQCRRHRLAPPQSLFHHWQEVWQVIKHSYISPGRLGYLAGEDWSRYLYCQAYFISMLPGLQKRLGDADARFMELELFDNVKLEQTANGDGSFCAKRLAALAAKDPVAFYRFESDYPGFFARAAVYYTLQDEGKLPAPPAPAEFEQHLAGIYQEPDAKFISQRTPTRLASASWAAGSSRTAQLTIAMPGGAHLLEWENNLCGSMQIAGFGPGRKVVEHSIHPYDNGFTTVGTILENDARYAGHPKALYAITRRLGFVALPDGHTCLWFSQAQANLNCHLLEHRGLGFNLANDLFNGHVRHVYTSHGCLLIQGLASDQGVVNTDSGWLHLDEGIGLTMLGILGADSFSIVTVPERNAMWQSLLYDQICYPYKRLSRTVQAGETVEKAAVLFITGNLPADLQDIAKPMDSSGDCWLIHGRDKQQYIVAINFHPDDIVCHLPAGDEGEWQTLAGPQPAGDHVVSVPPDQVAVYQLKQK